MGSFYLLLKLQIAEIVDAEYFVCTCSTEHTLSCSTVLPEAAWAMFLFSVVRTKREMVLILPEYRSILVHVDSRPKPTGNH
jgi:hypothetical protein